MSILVDFDNLGKLSELGGCWIHKGNVKFKVESVKPKFKMQNCGGPSGGFFIATFRANESIISYPNLFFSNA
jgi:hypothetical protein